MIRFLERDEIEAKSWDECISHAFNGNLYGYSWFLDIVCDDWAAMVEDDYVRVFPMAYRRKFGVYYIYQPFFTQQLGLYSRSALSQEFLGNFLEAIPRKFQRIELNLNQHNKANDSKYRLQPQLNHELDLIHPYVDISKSYSENLKRNLKKAQHSNVSLVRNPKPETIVELFRGNRGKEFRHLRESDYHRLLQMVYQCNHKGMADIRGVYDERNQLLAGAFFIRSHKKATFLFSGLSGEGREKAAMPFLIDSYIKENSNRHLTFDFDGSNDPKLAQFYKSFGSKEVVYPRVIIDRLPLLARLGYRMFKGIQ
jgi:hypothetical protein